MRHRASPPRTSAGWCHYRELGVADRPEWVDAAYPVETPSAEASAARPDRSGAWGPGRMPKLTPAPTASSEADNVRRPLLRMLGVVSDPPSLNTGSRLASRLKRPT